MPFFLEPRAMGLDFWASHSASDGASSWPCNSWVESLVHVLSISIIVSAVIMIMVASVRSVLDLSSQVLLRFCFERGFYKGEEEEDMRVFVAGGSTEFTGFYNPAVALAGAVVGDIGWTRMLVCISAEMVGGFVAAFLIWFTYLPHFQPLEFVQQGEDSLCNCCDLETGGVAVIKQELSEPAHRYLLSHIFKIICNMRPNIPVMI
jgi:hypothetical protein